MFNYSLFLKSIIANKAFFLFTIKNFFASMTISIEFMSSRVIDKIFIKFSSKFFAELTIYHDFFHFIFNEIENLFEIFQNRSCIMIAHFKKWRVKSLLFLINRSHSLHVKQFNILNDNFDVKNWNWLNIELIWR